MLAGQQFCCCCCCCCRCVGGVSVGGGVGGVGVGVSVGVVVFDITLAHCKPWSLRCALRFAFDPLPDGGCPDALSILTYAFSCIKMTPLYTRTP